MSARQVQMSVAKPGVTLTGDDELEQSITIVLTTPEGSVPGRPTFGSRFGDLLDMPVHLAHPLIVREVVRALRVSEPRVTVRQVTATHDLSGRLRPRLVWSRAGKTTTRTTEIGL